MSEKESNPIISADAESINQKLDELELTIAAADENEGTNYGLLEIHESNIRAIEMQIKKNHRYEKWLQRSP